ncbi:hypothetical protein HAZT_HAZT000069 [Hyalella azteca]|uniref:Hexosyltransferase n=1 Tax=Hyalella azteca TaxID=294128 RepID=A0A6A0H487_HYAAZ|nr:beta-1,3-galactosyltransferase 6-like [Hyalella azteca]KAA0199143.1 hypothetical protein HAZT_HAZT000069 [Hyalella azteca]
MRRSGLSSHLMCRKAVQNFAYLSGCFFCFLLGSFLSLSTMDPSVCDLQLCTKRLQHMSVDDTSLWQGYWDKNRVGQRKSVFLVILIISAPKNFELRNTIRQTWLKEEGRDCLHYFAVGIDGLSEDMNVTIQSEQRRFSDMLFLPNLKDSYSTLSQKLLSSAVHIHENVRYRFLLKCDDDSYVQLDRLVYELRSIPYKLRVYWGFFDGRATPFKEGPWKEDKWVLCDRYLPYALGGGYILSHDLVEFIASNSKWFQLYNSEDVSLSVWLAPLQLHRIHDTRFDTEYRSRGCHNDYIVTHKQTIQSMRDKFNHIQLDGTMCKNSFKSRSSYIYNWDVPPSKCCIRNDSSIP